MAAALQMGPLQPPKYAFLMRSLFDDAENRLHHLRRQAERGLVEQAKRPSTFSRVDPTSPAR